MLKKLMSLMLIVTLCFSILPLLPQVSAAPTYRYGNFVYSYVGSESVRLVGYAGDFGGSIRIPKTISGLPVSEIAEGAFQSSPIKTLAIEGRDLVIGKNAFRSCPIEVLTVYGGVADIGQGAFSDCPIEKVYIKKGVSTIRSDAFSPLADNMKTKIYFSGTKTEWSNINIYASNPVIKNADMTYSAAFVNETYDPELTLELKDGLFSPVTASATDNSSIAGYYIGDNETYYKNEFITTDAKSIDLDITDGGTYYFTAADINGNRSENLSVKLIEYSLDGNEISDMFKSYLIKAGAAVTPDAPEINTGDAFKGWSTDADASEGEMSFIPEDGKTYYAIWEKIAASDRDVTLSHSIEGDVLALTVGINNSKGLSIGELQVDFDNDLLSFKELKGYDKYYSAEYYKAADEKYCIGFSVAYENGLPSENNELCTLYFDILKRDGDKTDITVSGRWALAEAKKAVENVTLPSVPREFTLEKAVSEDTVFLTVYLEKGKYLTQGTLSLEYDTDVFTLTRIQQVSGWTVTASSPENDKSSLSFSCPEGKKLTDEKYDVCMLVFKVTDRSAGEKTIKISGTGGLSSAKGDSVTLLLDYTPEYTLGDVNNDGSITAADARLALRASVELEKLSETQTLAADVDKNKTVTAADARMILRASVGLEKLS